MLRTANMGENTSNNFRQPCLTPFTAIGNFLREKKSDEEHSGDDSDLLVEQMLSTPSSVFRAPTGLSSSSSSSCYSPHTIPLGDGETDDELRELVRSRIHSEESSRILRTDEDDAAFLQRCRDYLAAGRNTHTISTTATIAPSGVDTDVEMDVVGTEDVAEIVDVTMEWVGAVEPVDHPMSEEPCQTPPAQVISILPFIPC